MDFKNRADIARFLKHKDPRAWSLTVLDNAGVICMWPRVQSHRGVE